MMARQPGFRDLSTEVAAHQLKSLANPAEGGAEYDNLVRYCREDGVLDRRILHLVCSDTEAGEGIARILEACFRGDFQKVGTERCSGLRDDDPKAFASRGLRSLVNTMVRWVQRLRKDGYTPAIDATGGYKPQIAYAALVGQVMQVPVFYRYQEFARIIQLQPLPVAVDPEVWFEHFAFLERLREDTLPDREIPKGDARLVPLLERSDRLVTLSPLGELMAAAVEDLLGSRAEELLPGRSKLPAGRKKISYEDGNHGKHPGLADMCERITQAPYVTRISSFYFNRDLPKPTSVRFALDGSGAMDRLEVWYGNGKALTKMNVWTTARKWRELAAAHVDLERRLGVGR
jgi:putative CRISPR-associated protein (TIGR02619 family)